MSLKDAELFTGSFRNIRNDPLSSTLIRSLIRRFENECRGLRAAEHSREGRLAILTEILAQLEEMEKNLP